MRSGCSGERKYRYGWSHSPALKSGTLERAASTAADPKEKLPSGCVGGCFGGGSRNRNGEWGGSSDSGTLEIPTAVPFSDQGCLEDARAGCAVILERISRPPVPTGPPVHPSPHSPMYCFRSFHSPLFPAVRFLRPPHTPDPGFCGFGAGGGGRRAGVGLGLRNRHSYNGSQPAGFQ